MSVISVTLQNITTQVVAAIVLVLAVVGALALAIVVVTVLAIATILVRAVLILAVKQKEKNKYDTNFKYD